MMRTTDRAARLPTIVAILTALAASACTAPNAIFFREGTKLALDVTASASPQEDGPIQFQLGYKRSIIAVVPGKCVVSCPETKSPEEGTGESAPVEPREALSLVSSFQMRPGAHWSNVRTLYLTNTFATGEAAMALTADENAGALNKLMKEPNPSPPAPEASP